MGMKILGMQSGTTEARFTNIILEMKEKRLGNKNIIEEIDILVKENVKSIIFLTQNIHEIWNTMKRLIIWIFRIEEREECQKKAPENILKKFIEEKILT